MTREERQLRAWAGQVFRRAAIQWLRTQTHQYPTNVVLVDQEEGESWRDPVDVSTDVDTGLWMNECAARLRSRDRRVFYALFHGWSQTEIAHWMACDVSTVRRSMYRIRQVCPRWDP